MLFFKHVFFNPKIRLDSTHQGAEDALALGDGGHLLQGKLSQAQLTGHQRVQGQIPGGSVPRCGHDACCRAETQNSCY